MGGMLVAGLLLARFLKSSSPGAADNDFVYAGGGGSGSSGDFSRQAGSTGAPGTPAGARADVDTSWQPESGAYGGSTQRPNAPKLDNTRGTDLAPDDESGLGV